MSPGSQKNIVVEFFQRRSGSGSGCGEKKDVKDTKVAVVNLSEEPEVHRKHIKTVRERDIEVQHGDKKVKREGSGLASAKVVVEGDDVKIGKEINSGVENKDVTGTQSEKDRGVNTEPISGLKALLGAADASGSGGGDGEVGDGED
ncbi:hypothetical protein L1987_53322 [Smallanthus sonchifolius]|uniref:Uncharacterized protein n=1 Tax=Smallanthus sonchifolius TaxID=185202 RepID=A0ACB9EVX6_9ASTR|nr:hypothetical protein L1987_53322 [Smallanthus sonchifolius]